MLSKTSFFNQTLYRKTLSRFWPMWGMVTFVALLLPAALLLSLSQAGSVDAHELTQLYYYAVSYVIPIVSLIYAILCAVASWDYLFLPRNQSMMHTLPIKREGLFTTSFLSGMSMMLIPYAVTGIMCVLVSLLFGCFDAFALLETIVAVIALSLFYFCTATFVAFLTGNIFMFPALYFLLHFLAPLLDFLCCLLSGSFIYGLDTDYSGKVNFLSPTVYIMDNMDVVRLFEEVTDPLHPEYVETITTGYDLQGMGIIGAYVLVGLVLLGLAWLMYRSRRSECASDVVATKWMKPVFRYGIAALAAVCGGLVLYALLWGIVHQGTLMDAVPLAVFMTIAGIIGYYAASMLLAKSLRVFRGSWKGLLIVTAFSAAVCAVLGLDILGIGARVPDADDIALLTFRAADNSYEFVPGESTEDDALLAEVLELHAAIAADSDYIVDYLDNGRHYTTTETAASSIITPAPPEDVSDYNTVRFTYDLKDGSTLERRYSLHITRDRLEDPNTYDAKLDSLINSVEMRSKRLFTDREELATTYGYVDFNYGDYDSFSLNDREAAALLEAIRADAANETWGTYDWFGDDWATTYAMNVGIEFEYTVRENGSEYTSYENLHFDIKEGMTNTISALIELGYIESKDDLLTNPEREVYDFNVWLQEWYGKTIEDLTAAEVQKFCEESGYDYANIMAVLNGDTSFLTRNEKFPSYYGREAAAGLSEPYAIGVIGGADGPTEVTVAENH